MLELGERVYFSTGSAKNLKLTTLEDIEIFKALYSAEQEDWIKYGREWDEPYRTQTTSVNDRYIDSRKQSIENQSAQGAEKEGRNYPAFVYA